MQHYNMAKMLEEQRINADVESLQNLDERGFQRITPTKSPDDKKKYVANCALSLDYKDRVNAATFYLDGGEHHSGSSMRGGYIYGAALLFAILFGTGGFLIGASSKASSQAPIRAEYSSARGATVIPDESGVSEPMPSKARPTIR